MSTNMARANSGLYSGVHGGETELFVSTLRCNGKDCSIQRYQKLYWKHMLFCDIYFFFVIFLFLFKFLSS